jgi:hypothetical protein
LTQHLTCDNILAVERVGGALPTLGTTAGNRIMIPNKANLPVPPSQQTFADFIYAVVVGVAFSDIDLFAASTEIFATFFLLFVVLEDFFLYQTEVKPYIDIFNFTSFNSLLFEVSILLCWFLAFLLRSKAPEVSLMFFALFFFFKWLASVKHLKSAPRRWVIHRDHVFLVCVVAATTLSRARVPYVLIGTHIDAKWVILAGIWFVQTMVWWEAVKYYRRKHQNA